MNKAVKNLTKDELLTLLEINAKNLVALDGAWFQSLERNEGMDVAMRHDREAWRSYSMSEARRIKRFLELGEHPGLEGLAKALKFRCNSLANEDEIILGDKELVYRVVDCRVQNARDRKGMGLHPCKSVGTIEYSIFSENIDDRILCECLSCYPEIVDDTCNCAWRFVLK